MFFFINKAQESDPDPEKNRTGSATLVGSIDYKVAILFGGISQGI